jgi:hypothetical protein
MSSAEAAVTRSYCKNKASHGTNKASTSSGASAAATSRGNSAKDDASSEPGLEFRGIFGGVFSNSATNVPGNRDKQGVAMRNRFNVVKFRGGVEVVYHVNQMMSISVVGGLDVGQNKIRPEIGTRFAANSYSAEHLTVLLKNLFDSVSGNLSSLVDGDTIDGGTCAKLVKVLRYLGGGAEVVDPAFVTGPAGGDRKADDATLSDYSKNAATVRNDLAPFGVSMAGLDQLRDAIASYYPQFASLLLSIKDKTTWASGLGDATTAEASILGNIISPGVAYPQGVYLDADFAPICSMTAAAAIAAKKAFVDGKIAEYVKSASNGKPTFGVRPYVTIKFRGRLPWCCGDATYLFLGLGLIHQNGKASYDNGLAPESFSKLGTTASIGLERQLSSKNLAFSLEVTKTMKSTYNLGTTQLFGQPLVKKVKLEDTAVGLSIIYKF